MLPPIIKARRVKTMPKKSWNPDELKELTVQLPLYLVDLFEQQAALNGRAFNAELVNVLEKAIFIPPEDLQLYKDTAEAKAELDAIKEAADEEGQLLLARIRERNKVVSELSMLHSK
jgi:hypothetical protein